VEFTSQLMMIGAGLRGAVALALVKQMPTSASDEISSATLFIIFCTYRTALSCLPCITQTELSSIRPL
jgi:NhaP-type Na+/H+ or K+/H+ antiporter